ncbi:hypothetical protein [Streptomyces fulvorobeus]|uniref:Uncharacterized protein n=1 Tax=Streptomyces fulvorobeus TaxID=284028 RepID=A0A7J0CFY1_9ACTN|nr:hypothetical protein [Streptomyces fulvorobeus]NYE44870.1 hypothetical protein [Streptomyces fulvorobeus]GFN01411.1 hypothetical protein Sfulv_62210 [Streptomyces fulvorobeus]
MSDIPDAVERQPWQPTDGPAPTVRCWPPAAQPALYVRSGGRWRYAPVHARHEYPDGTVAYQAAVDLHGDTSVTVRLYPWPQPGLRRAHGAPDRPARG